MAFSESTMNRTQQVQLWYNRFKQGREDVNARPDCPSTSTADENIEAMNK